MTGRNKFWGKFQYVSEKQIELAIGIRSYRRFYNLSQKEMANMCNLYGEQHGIKFYPNEIAAYERFERAPRQAKYQILCYVLNINIKSN